MIVAILLACSGSTTGKDEDATDVAPTDVGPTDDTGTTDPGETGTTGGDTDTTDEPLELSGTTWRLHPEIQSMPYVSWTQSAAATVHVEYSFDPGVWESSPSVAYDAGTHERILVGIPYGYSVEWRVVADDGTTLDGPALATAALPDGLPVGTVTVSEPSRWEPTGKYLLTSINERVGGWTGGDYWTFILDRQGRVVWAHLAPLHHWTLFTTVARDGRSFYWDDATYWSTLNPLDEGEDGRIHHTWLDEEIELVPTPGLHHAWLELPDGTLVWGSQAHGGGEALVQKAPGQPDETVIWTASADWPRSGLPEFQPPESNGLFYAEATDSFLYSYYTNDSIVEVAHATGDSLWWAGRVPNGYAFDPPVSQYSWQHGITYTPSGTMLVSSEWDGGDGGPEHTWLMEYEVDHVNRQLHAVWVNDSGVLADTNGHAWRLPSGNTLHVVGSSGELREVETSSGEDVWRVVFNARMADGRLLGAGTFLEDLYPLTKPQE